MDKLELRLSVPFRLDGRPEQWPDCIFHYNSRIKALYTEALKRELLAASQDVGEDIVTAVTLEGCFFLMEYDQLTEWAQTVRRHFTLAEDVIWTARCEPGRLSTDILNFCKNTALSELYIDYRTSSAAEARALSFPSPLPEMQNTRQVLEHSAFPRFSLVVEDKTCNLTDQQWKETLRDAAGLGPMVIRLAQGVTDAHLEMALQKLAAFDYRPSADDPHTFVRKGMTLPVPPQTDGIIGCGLGAVTRLDGLACQNTTDLKLYLEASDQIERIARPLQA